MLLLGVLFSLSEGSRAIEDSKSLAALFKDLTVIAGEAEWVARQIQHLNVFKGLKHSAGFPEVAQLIESRIEAEQVGEVASNGA